MSFSTIDGFLDGLEEGDAPEPGSDWLTRLLPASFKGVPAFTLDTTFTFGRRIEVNEYPARESPHSKDLGRKADRFAETWFVHGENYDLARDKLVAALRSPGVGELVTERFGTHQVRILAGSVRESGRSGHFAKITFQAVEAGVNRSPSEEPATADALKKSAQSAQEGALVSFLLKAQSGVGWVRVNVVDHATSALDIFDRGMAIYKRGAAADAISNSIRALRSKILSDESLLLAHEFNETGSEILDIAADMAAVPDDVKERLRVLEQMRHDGDQEIGTLLGSEIPRAAATVKSPDEVVAQANREAQAALFRQALVIARGLVLLEADLSSTLEVDRLRDDFLVPIDDEIDQAGLVGDDDAYISLREFRAAVLLDLATRGEKIQEKADFTPPVPLSTLNLSQRLYGTGARAGDIADALTPEHPAFIAAQITIRVDRV